MEPPTVRLASPTQLRHTEASNMSTVRLTPSTHSASYPDVRLITEQMVGCIMPSFFCLTSVGLSYVMTTLMLLHFAFRIVTAVPFYTRTPDAEGYTTGAVPERLQHQNPVIAPVFSGTDIRYLAPRSTAGHTSTSRSMARRPRLRSMRTSDPSFMRLRCFNA